MTKGLDMIVTSVLVNRSALTQTRLDETAFPALGDGEVRLAVESFSVTANNVTYAVVGDAFGYWNFFPAPDGFGIIPMWGHARVTASKHAGIGIGERLYGYLPMASHLDILPGNVTAGSLIDTAAHRQPMSPIYNSYSRINADPEHDPDKEAERMLFGPLFKTSFLIEAMLRRADWFGATALVMTSASSKTAMALASVAKALSPNVRRIGLTSASNLDFVKRSALYDVVLAYDDTRSLPDAACVVVDFAGNSAVLRQLHEASGERLKYSCLVGATHVAARGSDGGGTPLPGPKPVLFFAPDHFMATVQELGAKGFGEAVAAQWHGFLRHIEGVVRIEMRDGLAAAADAFVETLKGNADPAIGVIVRP
ncbi:MAG: DUF2855 family protein [Sphingomonadaceae bacterium]